MSDIRKLSFDEVIHELTTPQGDTSLITIGHLFGNDPDSLHRFLAAANNVVRVIYLGHPYDETSDESRAALDATRALWWLAQPPEVVRVVAQRPPYDGPSTLARTRDAESGKFPGKSS